MTPAWPGWAVAPEPKGATGNVATEDLPYLLRGQAIATSVGPGALVHAGAFIIGVPGRPPMSRASKAMPARRSVAA